MKVKNNKIKVNTIQETDIVDITENIQNVISSSGIKNGIATVFVSGSTASVSTIEFEPNLVEDMKNAMERIVPSNIRYKHTETWGDNNGKSHVRATLMGPSVTIPFENGKLMLGTWQNIVILDFDTKAREREIIVTVIGD